LGSLGTAWVETLRGSIVAIDTAPLIYFIEKHPKYIARLRPFFLALELGEFQAVTSLVTFVEVLVKPLRDGRADLLQSYRDIILKSPNLTALPVVLEIAEEAALLRATYRLQTADSIQLATATVVGARWLLTNDLKLPTLPGLTTLIVDTLTGPN
jgi:predicted nucleic acid-binding protein